MRFKSETGEPFWVALECLPVECSRGEKDCVRVAASDVTVRKTAEMELQRQPRPLGIVSGRTNRGNPQAFRRTGRQ